MKLDGEHSEPAAVVASSPQPVARGATGFDAVVLGAGVSGLVAASVLLRQGSRSIAVVDSYPRLGGNHIDVTIGPYTFDVGSFIFQDDSPLVAHFPELLPNYVAIDPSWARLNPQGRVTAYPISIRDDILRAGPIGMARIALSVLAARLSGREGKTARDFARYWIGDYLLQRSGLEAYMRRFYGVPADQIDFKLAEKRMQWISEHASVANQIRRILRPPPKGPTNQQLARPHAGFASLYEPVRQKLAREGVTFLLGQSAERLTRSGDGFQLHLGTETLTAGRAISTIPLPIISQMCGLGADIGLQSINLVSLFFSFSGRRGYDASILYNFSMDGAWKRLTTYSDFYGLAEGREYFGVEVIGGHVENSWQKAEADFRHHSERNGLFKGDLRLEGHHSLDHSYPVYSRNAADKAAAAIATLRQFGVESFGRQGGFDYQPTARVSTQVAEAALTASSQ